MKPADKRDEAQLRQTASESLPPWSWPPTANGMLDVGGPLGGLNLAGVKKGWRWWLGTVLWVLLVVGALELVLLSISVSHGH